MLWAPTLQNLMEKCLQTCTQLISLITYHWINSKLSCKAKENLQLTGTLLERVLLMLSWEPMYTCCTLASCFPSDPCLNSRILPFQWCVVEPTCRFDTLCTPLVLGCMVTHMNCCHSIDTHWPSSPCTLLLEMDSMALWGCLNCEESTRDLKMKQKKIE